MIKLSVNRRTVELGDGSTLLDASREAGVYVPTLCHYPCLPSNAVCRMCLVDVDGDSKPQPACVTMAKEGDIVEMEFFHVTPPTVHNMPEPMHNGCDVDWLRAYQEHAYSVFLHAVAAPHRVSLLLFANHLAWSIPSA